MEQLIKEVTLIKLLKSKIQRLEEVNIDLSEDNDTLKRKASASIQLFNKVDKIKDERDQTRVKLSQQAVTMKQLMD
jgi:hypothetical protein